MSHRYPRWRQSSNKRTVIVILVHDAFSGEKKKKKNQKVALTAGVTHLMLPSESSPIIKHFIVQLMHTTLKNVELLKHFKY